MAPVETLTALDATFLELEELDDGALMSIGGVMVFGPAAGATAPELEALRATLTERLGELPRYTQRLSSTRTGGLAWPHWEPDPHFDVADHVRLVALPAPGCQAQLCEWTADFFSHPLDRTRALWEIVLIEGLEGGRWALAHKTHHCLVDGVGSVDVVGVLLDSQADAGSSGKAPMAPNGKPSSARAPQAMLQAGQAAARAAGAGVHAVVHPRDALHRSRALAELIIRDELIAAPRTSLNVPIGPTRRFAVIHAQLDELKAIGHAAGGSMNDAALAACATGLRTMLLARGEQLPARGLRVMVPVNIRDASGDGALGNRISSLFVDLPVAQSDPWIRLRTIVAATKKLKRSGAADGAAAAIDLGALAPPVAHRAAMARTEFSTRLFNVTITNVPGAQQQLYAFGCPLREVHPVVPLAAQHVLGIAIFSYNGQVTFGINADRAATPDIDVLARGIEDGLEELRKLLLAPARARKPRRAGSGRLPHKKGQKR